MITHGDLFTGLGGFSLAAERAGITTLWSVEIDPTCRQVLAHHWPDVPRYEDVTTVSGRTLPPVHVITAGFPCQDLSVAGDRAGLAGDRSGLFFEIVRIVREMQEVTDGLFPEYVLLENVPGILTSNRGRDFAMVIAELANLGAMDIGWRVLDARFFGVAQRRRRVFVVADFGGRRTEAILALSESLSGHPAPGRQTREVVAATLNSSAPGERGYRNDADTAENLIVARALTAAASSGSGDRMDGETDTLVVGVDLWNNSINKDVSTTLQASVGSGSRAYVANTITASAGHHGRSSPRGDGSDNLVLAFSSKDSGADATLDLAPTMRAMNYDQSWLNGGGQLAVAVSLRSREGEATAEMGDEVSHALRSSKGGGDKPHVLAFDWQASAGNDTSWRGKGRQFIVRKGEQAGTLGATRVDAVMTTAPMPLYYTHDYNQDRVYDPAGVAPAVCAADSGGARNVLTSNDGDPHSNFSPVAVVRRLMPIECARLQGFPDDWIPSTIADSHHYRMLGNAVCVPVVEWLLRRLAAALEAS